MALMHCFGEEKIFLTWDAVMFPGKECRSPALMALQRVDMYGKKRVAWKKAIRAARCGSGHKALAAWDVVCAGDELIVVYGSAACEKVFTVAASLYRAFGDLVSLAIQSWLLAAQVPLSRGSLMPRTRKCGRRVLFKKREGS